MTMTKTAYAVVRRPGFRDHEMRVLSAHQNADAAARAAARHDYADARGQTMRPCEVIHVPAGCRKGETLWDDTCGRTRWAAV